MRIGIKFPTRELGSDAALVREWAARAGGLGFSHISFSDHVLGVDPTMHPEWAQRWSPDPGVRPPYTIDDDFHEPLVTMGFLAAVTDVELSTGVLILPQRQAALVAKQAAQVDILSGGRLRLGVAGGWNSVESEALGTDFASRAARIEEQISVMRELWTQRGITYRGRYESLVGVGISPPPIQRPIPIWIGGFAEVVLRRAGRIGDGWVAGTDPDQAARLLPTVLDAQAQSGRSSSAFGIEGRLGIGDTPNGLDELEHRVEAWRKIEATHLTIETMGLGAHGAQHLDLLGEVATRVSL